MVESLTSRLPKDIQGEADALFALVFNKGADIGARAALAVSGMGLEMIEA